MKIAFLNDMHPLEFPGAATIAHNLAREASLDDSVEFWCSSSNPNTLKSSGDLKECIVKSRPKTDARRSAKLGFKLVGEFTSFRNLFWVTRRLMAYRPDVLWIHQIGFRFPRTVILVARLFGVKTVLTLHDFASILPRKLYPSDLGILDGEVAKKLTSLLVDHSIKAKLKVREPLHFRIAYGIRLRLTKFIYHRTSTAVSISLLQERILTALGFKISGVIPNGVDPCSCSEQNLERERGSILFAGRPNAKGLEAVIDAITISPDSHLHLAGPVRLMEMASLKLHRDRYTYHGQISRQDLFGLIHRVELVAVLSECFDVFPTITLEALRHGTNVMTTLTTGNADLIEGISPSLIIQYRQVPNLSDIQNVIRRSDVGERLNEASKAKVLEVSQSLTLYRQLFRAHKTIV